VTAALLTETVPPPEFFHAIDKDMPDGQGADAPSHADAE
jgi:hypothetical protein